MVSIMSGRELVLISGEWVAWGKAEVHMMSLSPIELPGVLSGLGCQGIRGIQQSLLKQDICPVDPCPDNVQRRSAACRTRLTISEEVVDAVGRVPRLCGHH